MADIMHELIIAATPEAIYKAITEQSGLASWWTTVTKAQPKVGSVGEFTFNSGTFVIKMEVTRLEPSHHVDWMVQQGAPDWSGTRVTWELTPNDKGTKVRFGHLGFASTDGSLAETNYNWGWFLTSLKAYAETGKGTPVS